MGELFYECGCCGACHRYDYYGDCRNDAERFAVVPDHAIVVGILVGNGNDDNDKGD